MTYSAKEEEEEEEEEEEVMFARCIFIVFDIVV
jgi:hypothetical protein